MIGSNVANLLLILGLAAALTPVAAARPGVLRDGAALLGATALFVAFAAFGTIVAWQGALMLVLLGLLTCFSYWHERRRGDEGAIRHRREGGEASRLPRSIRRAALFVLFGLGAVAGGAHFLVGAATIVARGLGITETVIGVTVVAVGTSLPELATTVVAAYRRHTEVALGNVLGSSVFNIFAIVGVVTAVTPLPVPAEVMRFDIWALAGITILATAAAMSGIPLGRPLGVFFLLAYAAFVAVQYLGA